MQTVPALNVQVTSTSSHFEWQIVIRMRTRENAGALTWRSPAQQRKQKTTKLYGFQKWPLNWIVNLCLLWRWQILKQQRRQWRKASQSQSKGKVNMFTTTNYPDLKLRRWVFQGDFWSSRGPRHYFTPVPIQIQIGVCGITVLSDFSYGFTVFSIHNCGIAVSSSTTVRVILAFWAGVFGKMSNFVRYFGEGTFLTMLVREGILRKFQCGFR